MLKYSPVRTFLLLAFCMLAARVACAQYPSWQLEMSGLVTAYRGDLSKKMEKRSPVVSATLKLNRYHKWDFGITGFYGQLVGDNPDFQKFDSPSLTGEPNNHFFTSIAGGYASAYYNFILRKDLKVYFSPGIGLLYFDPQDAEGRSLLAQPETRDREEPSYNGRAIILPMGLGVSYLFKNGFGVGARIQILYPRTDYLDNISRLAGSENTLFGTRPTGDNIYQMAFSFSVPLSFSRSVTLR